VSFNLYDHLKQGLYTLPELLQVSQSVRLSLLLMNLIRELKLMPLFLLSLVSSFTSAVSTLATASIDVLNIFQPRHFDFKFTLSSVTQASPTRSQ
jgi:hypothetical protein